MKYYQAVYQTDSHGFNIVYSKNIWTTKEDAQEYLDELINYLIGDNGPYMYDCWINELWVDTP